MFRYISHPVDPVGIRMCISICIVGMIDTKMRVIAIIEPSIIAGKTIREDYALKIALSFE